MGETSTTPPPSPSLKRRILFALQRTLGASRIGDLYARFSRPNQAVVLMYHSVCRSECTPWVAPRNRMGIDRFERQLKRLAKSGRVIPVSRLITDNVSPGSIVLTFDDGYLDNLEIVAPLLAKYELPAVLYLATGYVRDAEPQWADMVYAAIRSRKKNLLKLGDIGVWNLSQESHREAAIYAIGRAMIEATRAERSNVLNEIRDQLEAPECPVKLTMNFDDARRLAKEYPSFELGVHTADHLDMSAINTDEAITEIQKSMDDFRREFGRDAEHFSFPYSRSTPEVIARLSDIGLKTAMTGEGVVPLDDPDLYDLKRFESPESPALFRYWTSGAHPSLTRKLTGRS